MTLGPGDVGVLVQTSLCAGGLLRTWTEAGETALWSVPDAATFAQMQGIGVVGRTAREEKRYREVALLYPERNLLAVQAREPVKAQDGSVSIPGRIFELKPEAEPTEATLDEVVAILSRAVNHVAEVGEYLLVEPGGWTVPDEPYCLFLVAGEPAGLVSVLEAWPAPHASEAWAPHIAEGAPNVVLTAPAHTGTIGVVPMMILEAVSTWGLEPWDVALTFGEREKPAS
ncbi:MAG: hypothetical protein ACT4QF_12275 [Sporichthyaceae bacterium]